MYQKVTVSDILTDEETNHIKVLRESMKDSRTPIGVIKSWLTIKKIINLAEDRYHRGVAKGNFTPRLRNFIS